MSAGTSDALRRAIRTFVFATLGLAIPGLLGWLNDLTRWARDNGTTPFPDAHGLLFLLVSAIAAGFIALLNFVWAMVENAAPKAAFLRNPPPNQPVPGEQGVGVLYVLLVVAAACLVLILLARVL
ncbi:MAG TPA: hypothetical protein VIL10_00305 [Marmoricola sp.]